MLQPIFIHTSFDLDLGDNIISIKHIKRAYNLQIFTEG